MKNWEKIIAKGESPKLEFKSTLRVDLKTNKPEKFIEHSVLKTLAAFLNSYGGTLLIGVEDNRNILGLNKDFNSFLKPDKLDEFQKHFDNIIQKSIGDRFHHYLQIDFPAIDNKAICAVNIKEKSSEPVYLTDEKGEERFYIRRQASTVDLKQSESYKYIKEHWKQIIKIDQQKSVKKSVDIFKSKEIFQKEFNRILLDKNSAYYQELKQHWNSYSLINESPFLNKIIKQFLPKSISFGLLPLISDFARKQLYNDKDAKYIYNQPHIYMHNREEEGYDLPIYYHIQFIGILYATSIRNKVDIDIVSRNNKNMQSIYSGMIEGMIDNISVVSENDSTEYPTNYHWLISEILSITNHWLDEFNEEENYVETSSYIDYITFNICQCFSELYQGRKKNKFEIKFIVSQFYYKVLTSYFSPLLNDSLRNSIEENIIIKIQKDLVQPILKLSLDEKYAVRTDEFYEGHYHVLNDEERKILNRFRNFLIDNKKI